MGTKRNFRKSGRKPRRSTRPGSLLRKTRNPNSTLLANLSYDVAASTDISGNLGWVYYPGTVVNAFDWSSYANAYILYRVREYRVSWVPFYGRSATISVSTVVTPIGSGSGIGGVTTLNGPATTAPIVPSAPTSVNGVIQYCADYRHIYNGKPFSFTVKHHTPNQMLWFQTGVSGTSNACSQVMGWTRAGIPSLAIGQFVVQFVVEFARS
jgi:hypothetical protein